MVMLNWRWEGLHWKARAFGSTARCPFIRGLAEQQARQRICRAVMGNGCQPKGCTAAMSVRRNFPAVSRVACMHRVGPAHRSTLTLLGRGTDAVNPLIAFCRGGCEVTSAGPLTSL